MNKKEIFVLLQKLAVGLGEDVTLERLKILTELLSKHEYKFVENSVFWALENCRFFPRPVELIEKIKELESKDRLKKLIFNEKNLIEGDKNEV